MSTLVFPLISAVFNALCFLLLYRVFSAQVESLERQVVALKRDVRVLRKCGGSGVGIVEEGGV